ncbi:hypothetical protein PIIN_10883 [Serendipita indica DSM 11827]|uniref:Uncharacterized protein n=2 Tax=Serendipita indica (strain DSM 11827) TaxID=1109443 RepID=G4U005_SERID|nr:hypothetical protein PIIN_10883 [Serendipita indica DSM 11827]
MSSNTNGVHAPTDADTSSNGEINNLQSGNISPAPASSRENAGDPGQGGCDSSIHFIEPNWDSSDG